MGFFTELAAGKLSKGAIATVAKQGKTEEQKKVIDYFLSEGGCFSKAIKDSEYDELVQKKINSINWEEKIFNRLGIDKSQVAEVEPIISEGYYTYSSDFGEDKLKTLFKIYSKEGEDEKYRTSAYQRTYMYFSDDQVFLYQLIFHMDCNDVKEVAKEYFYKDITSFSSQTTTEEKNERKKSGCLKKASIEKTLIEKTEFTLIVPGDQFSVIMFNDEMRDASIQGMKAKFREKKNA